MKKEQIKRGGKQGVQQLFPGIAGSGEVGKVEPKKADRALHQYTFPLLSVPWPFHSFGRASCTCSSLFLHVVTLLSCFSRVELISGHKRRLTAGFELLTCFAFFPSLAVAVCRAPTFRFLGIPLLPSESSLPLTPLATNSCFIPLLLPAGARVETAPA